MGGRKAAAVDCVGVVISSMGLVTAELLTSKIAPCRPQYTKAWDLKFI